MKKRSRRIILLILLGVVSLTVFIAILYRDPLLEVYWIQKLKDDSQSVAASRKLAKLECFRSIPDIVEAYKRKLKQDRDTFIGYAYTASNPLKDPPLIQEVKIHPMLYSIYSMGNGGDEHLKSAMLTKLEIQNYYRESGDKSNNVDPFGPSRFNQLEELQVVLKLISENWNETNNIQLVEGSAGETQLGMPVFLQKLWKEYLEKSP